MNLWDRVKSASILTMLAFTMACEDPSDIGIGFTPEDSIRVFFREFPINITTTLSDSIISQSFGGSRLLLGGHVDDVFGRTSASIATQFVPTIYLNANDTVFPLDPVVDPGSTYQSTELNVTSSEWSGNNFNQSQTYRVYRIWERDPSDVTYISTSTPEIANPLTGQPDLIGEFTGFWRAPASDQDNAAMLDTSAVFDNFGNIIGIDTVVRFSIPIDDVFGNLLFDDLSNNDMPGDPFYPQDSAGFFGTNFIEKYNGLYIVPDEGNSIVLSPGIGDVQNTNLELSYRNAEGTDIIYRWIFFDGNATIVVTYNNIESDRSGTSFLDQLQIQEDLDDDGRFAYVKGGAGIITRFNFDSLFEFFQDFSLVKFNRAEIVIDSVDVNDFQAPGTLLFYLTDSTNRYIQNYFTSGTDFDYVNALFRGDPVPTFEITGGSTLQSEFDGLGYSVITTIFLQDLVDGTSREADFFMVPQGFSTSLDQFRVSKENIKLRVYYSAVSE